MSNESLINPIENKNNLGFYTQKIQDYSSLVDCSIEELLGENFLYGAISDNVLDLIAKTANGNPINFESIEEMSDETRTLLNTPVIRDDSVLNQSQGLPENISMPQVPNDVLEILQTSHLGKDKDRVDIVTLQDASGKQSSFFLTTNVIHNEHGQAALLVHELVDFNSLAIIIRGRNNPARLSYTYSPKDIIIEAVDENGEALGRSLAVSAIVEVDLNLYTSNDPNEKTKGEIGQDISSRSGKSLSMGCIKDIDSLNTFLHELGHLVNASRSDSDYQNVMNLARRIFMKQQDNQDGMTAQQSRELISINERAAWNTAHNLLRGFGALSNLNFTERDYHVMSDNQQDSLMTYDSLESGADNSLLPGFSDLVINLREQTRKYRLYNERFDYDTGEKINHDPLRQLVQAGIDFEEIIAELRLRMSNPEDALKMFSRYNSTAKNLLNQSQD